MVKYSSESKGNYEKEKENTTNIFGSDKTSFEPRREDYLCSKEPFRWSDLQTRWLVLTDLRLVILYKTLIGVVSVDDIHLRDLDIEYVRTKLGLFDMLVFRNRDRLLYQTAASRTRRAEVEDFIRTTTLAITKREASFRASLAQNQETACDQITTLKELNKLRQDGAITEGEYLAKKDEILKKI